MSGSILLKIFSVLFIICGAVNGCAVAEKPLADPQRFDGRWEARIISPPSKRSSDAFEMNCRDKTRDLQHFTVRDGAGSLVTGGPRAAKGSVLGDGSFVFQTVYRIGNGATAVKRKTILRGSLVELTGLHSYEVHGFDIGCDYKVSIRKVAERFM